MNLAKFKWSSAPMLAGLCEYIWLHKQQSEEQCLNSALPKFM